MIEAIIECLPQRKLISAFDLIKEPIDSGNSLTFVVSTKNDNLFRETSLESKKKADDLATLLSSVYIVAKEEIFMLSTQNLLLLILLVLIGHLFEHMQ